MLKLEISVKDAKALLHCLKRTHARNHNNALDISEKYEELLYNFIKTEQEKGEILEAEKN